MPALELLLSVRWIIGLWLVGWLVLPLSSRVLGRLPDQGLAAGRFLALFVLSLVSFWTATLHLLPLGYAPLLFGLLLLSCGAMWLDRGGYRPDWSPEARRNLLVSDAVFLLAYFFFLWVRFRFPEANNLEKPMDAALISSAQRAQYLPFQDPYFAGQPFTNYYYFGPLMCSLLGRILVTPPWYTFNLAQPAFCAFFLSMLWSVGAAVTRSWKWGLGVALLVGYGGQLEPLREIWDNAHQGRSLWTIDWWATSRVIPFTINEYPCFTLTIGDVHSHFFALAFAVLFFGLAWNVLLQPAGRQGRGSLLTAGVVLGGILLTNTWDAPFYALLLGLTVRYATLRDGAERLAKRDLVELRVTGQAGELGWGAALLASWMVSLLLALMLAPLVAAPYFARFKPQIKGGILNTGFVWQPWIPQPVGLFLVWGGWLLWALIGFGLGQALVRCDKSPEAVFRRLLLYAGFPALAFPFFLYIRGYMLDGDWRHIDTVFKFWLQAWLLLGLAIASQTAATLGHWWPIARPGARKLATLSLLALCSVLCLAPAGVLWARVWRDATAPQHGHGLNAMRHLNPGEQEAVQWLWSHAGQNESYLEAATRDGEQPGGEYDPYCGRVASFSGVPAYLGWPQHAMFWGADWAEVVRRNRLVPLALSWTPGPEGRKAMRLTNVDYIFVGEKERNLLQTGPMGQSILDQYPSVWGYPQLTKQGTNILSWQPCILAAKLVPAPPGGSTKQPAQ